LKLSESGKSPLFPYYADENENLQQMIKYATTALLLLGFAASAHAQSILPDYLLGQWQLVENTEADPGHSIAPLEADKRISPTDHLAKDAVHLYFYEDNRYQKSIYFTSNKNLMLGSGSILSYQDGVLILELEEMYDNGKQFSFLKVMPELQYDTLHIAQMPPFHFTDMLEYPSAYKPGEIRHDTLYFLKIKGLTEESGE
jgi:hypothetical protein